MSLDYNDIPARYHFSASVCRALQAIGWVIVVFALIGLLLTLASAAGGDAKPQDIGLAVGCNIMAFIGAALNHTLCALAIAVFEIADSVVTSKDRPRQAAIYVPPETPSIPMILPNVPRIPRVRVPSIKMPRIPFKMPNFRDMPGWTIPAVAAVAVLILIWVLLAITQGKKPTPLLSRETIDRRP